MYVHGGFVAEEAIVQGTPFPLRSSLSFVRLSILLLSFASSNC